MPGQAGMIGGNHSANFESHWLRIYRYVIPSVSRGCTVVVLSEGWEESKNDEARMTNDEGMTKLETRNPEARVIVIADSSSPDVSRASGNYRGASPSGSTESRPTNR